MKDKNPSRAATSAEYAKSIWEESWTYIKTVVDTVREPFLVLDKDLRVMAANDCFYRTFQVSEKDTVKKHVYDLGNGQWDIASLRKLLEKILPKNEFFYGYEVRQNFPGVGRKVMILNARRIFRAKTSSHAFPPTILLAMEDVTKMMAMAERFSTHSNTMETRMMDRTKSLETKLGAVEKEIAKLKKSKEKNNKSGP